MKLQTKISIFFGPFLLIVITSLFLLNYIAIHNGLKQKAFTELKKIHNSVHLSTEALLQTAITNYLRGITEKNIDIVEFYYNEFQKGNLTEQAAKDSIQKKCNLQKVGRTGYLVAVGEKEGELYLGIHPYARYQHCSESEACLIWNNSKNGYVEYEWKNPNENQNRKKVAFITEFTPWKWIFGATSYKDEFIDLIKVEDLREMISSIKINKSGYFYLFNNKKQILIHPEIEGKESSEVLTKSGKELIPELINDEDGFVEYEWKNPSDKNYRKKYAYIKKIDHFDWYLGGSGYIKEIAEPLNHFKTITLFLIILSSLILTILVIFFSKHIAIPLHKISEGIDNFYNKNITFEWKNINVNEIDYLGSTFSNMVEHLQNQMRMLKQKIEELDTSHKEKEEMTQFLQNIINSMPSILIGITPDYHITQWNKNAEEQTNILKYDAINQNLFVVYPKLRKFKEEIDKSLTRSTIIQFSYNINEASSEVKSFDTTIYPLRNPGRTAAVIRIDDISEKVLLENELNQSRKMEAVGQLAGGVAHDFNNMLTGILNSVENLKDNIKESQNIKSLGIIKDAALRTRDLTKNLLNFSRQKVKGNTPLDLNKVLDSTIHMLKHSIKKNIEIKLENSSINNFTVGDFSQIQNVLLNLGINADHAMINGGQLIYKTSNIIENGKEFILIEIIDNGSGIPNEIHDKIFNPFFTTKKQGEGTGLGLASAYAVIEQHEGKISFDSEMGKGTTFKILLPTSKVRVNKTENKIDDKILKTLKNYKILVIDDEEIVRETIVTMLQFLHADVISASNGHEGIDFYHKQMNLIDIVILDMRMPKMNGPECFKELKKINPDVKVIISSGYSKEGNIEELEKDGLAGFVSKPYRKAELLKVISKIIN